MEEEGLHPITYRLPRSVSGQEIIDTHIACMQDLMDDGWEGGARGGEQGNAGIKLHGSHSVLVKFWILPSFRWYDFLVASKEEIIPTHTYPKGTEIPFILSDSTGEDLGLLRWIQDTKDKLFQKLRPRWRIYTNALDAALSGAMV